MIKTQATISRLLRMGKFVLIVPSVLLVWTYGVSIYWLYRSMLLKFNNPGLCSLDTPYENAWDFGQIMAMTLLLLQLLAVLDAYGGTVHSRESWPAPRANKASETFSKRMEGTMSQGSATDAPTKKDGSQASDSSPISV